MVNQSNTSNDKPRTVQDIIRAIEAKSEDGEDIFRGEPECNEKVSSNLWRELDAVKAKCSDIKAIQSEIVADAKEYTDNKTDDFDILIDLQHYGGKTNLTTTTDMGVDIIASFHNNYENVSDFEGKHGIQLPVDITAMLTP